jgi:hypothetical protein
MSNFNKLKQYASNIKKPDSSMMMSSDVSHAPKEVREYQEQQIKKQNEELEIVAKPTEVKSLFTPKKKSKRIMNYRLDDELADRITGFCTKHNITVTEFHVKIAEEFLKINGYY